MSVDHHVHVRAREAADELGERERKDQASRRSDRTLENRGVARGDRDVSHLAYNSE